MYAFVRRPIQEYVGNLSNAKKLWEMKPEHEHAAPAFFWHHTNNLELIAFCDDAFFVEPDVHGKEIPPKEATKLFLAEKRADEVAKEGYSHFLEPDSFAYHFYEPIVFEFPVLVFNAKRNERGWGRIVKELESAESLYVARKFLTNNYANGVLASEICRLDLAGCGSAPIVVVRKEDVPQQAEQGLHVWSCPGVGKSSLSESSGV